MSNPSIRATLAAAALLVSAVAPSAASASEAYKSLTVQSNLRTCNGQVALSSYPRPLWQDGIMRCGAWQFTPPPSIKLSGRTTEYAFGNETWPLARNVASASCIDYANTGTTSLCELNRQQIWPLIPQSRYEGKFEVIFELDGASYHSWGERWGALPSGCGPGAVENERIIRCNLSVRYFTPNLGE